MRMIIIGINMKKLALKPITEEFRERNLKRRLSSKELLDNKDQLLIEHEGQEYVLRITRNGKLILETFA
jgi:hemin uptake protein HemP